MTQKENNKENRIFEALIARITLSFLAYNLTSYINRINNEPQTLGSLFKDLECQLETLAHINGAFSSNLRTVDTISSNCQEK